MPRAAASVPSTLGGREKLNQMAFLGSSFPPWPWKRQTMFRAEEERGWESFATKCPILTWTRDPFPSRLARTGRYIDHLRGRTLRAASRRYVDQIRSIPDGGLPPTAHPTGNFRGTRPRTIAGDDAGHPQITRRDTGPPDACCRQLPPRRASNWDCAFRVQGESKGLRFRWRNELSSVSPAG